MIFATWSGKSCIQRAFELDAYYRATDRIADEMPGCQSYHVPPDVVEDMANLIEDNDA